MQERRFILCDQSEVYVERFMEYVQHKANFMFTVFGFSDPGQAQDFLEEREADLALLDERIWEQLSPEERVHAREKIRCPVILTEQRCGGEERKIFRYQSMEQILRDLVSCYEQCGGDEEPEESRTRMAAFWSPVGRCGKTAGAMALGQRLAEHQGLKILYVNLEDMPGVIPGLGETMGNSLSDHLYYHRMGGQEQRIMSLTGTVGHISVIGPPVNPEDLWEADPGELRELLEGIRSRGIYDWILLDLGRGGDPLPVLSLCRRILIFTGEDENSREKTRRALNYLERRGADLMPGALRVLKPTGVTWEASGEGAAPREWEEWLEREWITWDSNRSRSMD